MQKHSNRYESMCRAAYRARHARSEKNKTKEFIQQRFWSKVDKRGQDECWPWIAGVAGVGYGAFRIKNRKTSAHRFAWESVNGPIPEGLIACHHCDNIVCCNPYHIFIGTHKDNINDCISKGRLNPPKGERHGLRKLSEKDVIEIRNRYRSGESRKNIVKDFQVGAQAITNIITGFTWKDIAAQIPCAVRKPIGEHHGARKLTNSEVIDIRRSYVPRKTTMQILSAKYGVAIETIFDVIHHRSWKHITQEP